ncbi:MAG: hypothetical protein BMS9Abin07_2290 [Acidimicrobiia bacterium]|nr:MAG: hypothetical protein BMS9Abin07_2290 [Acidimicrobiia bacterium]
MRRDQLEHIVRASAEIAGDPEVVVFGSQAILCSYDHAVLPAEAIGSIEADVTFFADETREKADAVTGAIGELSLFHQTFGVYADGVEIGTATLPPDWQQRAVLFDTPMTKPGRAVCLEPHDLAVSKLVAFRDKDLRFVRALIDEGLLDADVLSTRVRELPIDEDLRSRLLGWLAKRR